MTATETAQAPASRRNEKVGNVVSTKMQKTIVVEVEMRKAHKKYKRIVKSSKKFYAHDEQNSARVGRRGAHPRDPAAEQAEAVESRRDRAPLLAGADRRTGSAAGCELIGVREKRPWQCK